MSRSIDIDPSGNLLRIAFPYDREILDVVRALPQRRFSRDDKSWYVPIEHIDDVIGTLHPLSFELTDDVEAHCLSLDKDLDAILARAKKTYQPVIDLAQMPAGTWSVASLNEESRRVLQEAFRESVWLAAEIQGFDRNKRTGHAFFELIHRPFSRADPTAKIAAVLWEQERTAIETALSQDGASVRLRDGLIVRVLVKVDFYTGQGRYQVNVQELDLAYTDGTMQQNRERVLRLLEQEQLAELNLFRSWPICPLRIGLITSYESDAYMDFVHELQQSGVGFQVYVHHAQVQGSNTESSVLKALKYFAEHSSHFDALAIVRGGGARSDLAYFDTEAIGRAVCQHPLKIVVGVGHQRDICLLDFIAYSEKTPTAAAQFFVDRVRTVTQTLHEQQDQLIEMSTTYIEDQRDHLQRLAQHSQQHIRLVLEHEHRLLERIAHRVQLDAHVKLDAAQRTLEHIKSALPAASRAKIHLTRTKLEHQNARIEPHKLARLTDAKLSGLNTLNARLEQALKHHTRAQAQNLKLLETRLSLLDPKRILERGFALVRHKQALLRDPNAVSTHDQISIEMASGTVFATITDEEE